MFSVQRQGGMNMAKSFIDGNDRLDALLAQPGMAERVAEIHDRADEEDRAREIVTRGLPGRGQPRPAPTECSRPLQP